MDLSTNPEQITHLYWKKKKKQKKPFTLQSREEIARYELLRSVALPVCSLGTVLCLFLRQTGQMANGWILVFLAAILTIIYQLLAQIGPLAARIRTFAYILVPLFGLLFYPVRKGWIYERDLFAQTMKNYGIHISVSQGIRDFFLEDDVSLADSVSGINFQLLVILGAASILIVFLCFLQRKKEWTLLLVTGLLLAWFLLRAGVWPGAGASTFFLLQVCIYAGMSIPAILVSSILILCAFAVTSPGTNSKNDDRSPAWRWLEEKRYHIQPEVLPEGRIDRAIKLDRKQREIDLHVRPGRKQSSYLRGFTGAVYDGKSWSMDPGQLQVYEMAGGLLVDEGTIFYSDSDNGWISLLDLLHRHSFYGLTQLASSRKDAAEKGKTADWSHVTWEISNVGGNRKNIYIPYETTSAYIRGQEEATIGSGEMVVARGFTGRRDYEVSALDNAAGMVMDFDLETENEALYASYVSATCLGLDKEVREYLTEELSDHDPGKSIPAIVSQVRGYLKKNMVYDKSPGEIPAGSDFFTWFFDGKGRGYDVHFASAAVLLFRYYGIPSRYVEGYILPDELLGRTREPDVNVPESYAHAWPEIYIRGAGWIPVEVTDPYIDLMTSYYEPDPLLVEHSDPDSAEETEAAEDPEGMEEESETDTSEERKTSEEEESEEKQEETDRADQTDEEGEMSGRESRSGMTWLAASLGLLALVIFLSGSMIRSMVCRMKIRFAQRRGRYNRAVILACREMEWALDRLEEAGRRRGNRKSSPARPGDNRKRKIKARIRRLDRKVSVRELEKSLMTRDFALYAGREVSERKMRAAVAFFERETYILTRGLPLVRRLKWWNTRRKE